jgi:hypothetical protein
LVVFTGSTLVVIFVGGYLAQRFWTTRSFLAAMVFGIGLVGGFVSLQQRLPKTSTSDLKRLSDSWFALLLIPINGGVFAVVLHVAFIAQIVQGSLFPTYQSLERNGAESGAEAIVRWLREIAPTNSVELAKLLFWAFVAGFSERLVPQILQTKTDSASGAGQDRSCEQRNPTASISTENLVD